MPLGSDIGLSQSDIVLDGKPAPPPHKGTVPQFSAYICGQMAVWIMMPLGMGGRLEPKRHYVRWGLSSPPPKGGGALNFRPMFIVAKRLDG